jgi:2-octaprenyl-6-methoxyphenol hydroxylase
MQTNPNITIIGCSYNGMLTALALASIGIKSTIIEKRKCDDKFFHDPRTTSITSSSKDFLINIDTWPQLEKHTSQIDHIYVVDNKKPNSIEFNSSELAVHDHLGYMVQNYDLKKTLYDAVKQNNLITVINGIGYEDVVFNDGCQILLDNQSSINTDLVIICDGKNSRLRAKYFPYLINKDYHQAALVFNVAHELEHQNCAVEHFLPTGPFAILPLANQNQSAIVWSIKADLAMMYQNLDQETFTKQVQNLFGDFLGKVKLITKISAFNLSAQIVRRYFYNNLVVVGDSAHCIHPLAGQGLNQGIKDIKALSQIIKKYTDLGLDINSIALTEYERARKHDNLKMFLATDFLDKIFSNNSSALSIIRTLGFNFLNRFPNLKDQIINYGIGV